MLTYNEKNNAKWSAAIIQYLFDISLHIFPQMLAGWWQRRKSQSVSLQVSLHNELVAYAERI